MRSLCSCGLRAPSLGLRFERAWLGIDGPSTQGQRNEAPNTIPTVAFGSIYRHTYVLAASKPKWLSLSLDTEPELPSAVGALFPGHLKAPKRPRIAGLWGPKTWFARRDPRNNLLI